MKRSGPVLGHTKTLLWYWEILFYFISIVFSFTNKFLLQLTLFLLFISICVSQGCHQTSSPWSRSDASCGPPTSPTRASCVTCSGQIQTRMSSAGERMTEESHLLLVQRLWQSSCTNMIWIWSVAPIRYVCILSLYCLELNALFLFLTQL